MLTSRAVLRKTELQPRPNNKKRDKGDRGVRVRLLIELKKRDVQKKKSKGMLIAP
jgi:hypothetical protein